MLYQTQVQTASLSVERFIRDYCAPERFLPCCAACPEYGSNWACPPDVPTAEQLLAARRTVCLVGVQVRYDPALRARATDGDRARRVREETYEPVKRLLNETLLCLERQCPGAVAIAAGSCQWCDRCARLEGKPCRQPERRRYSFSALGFDLGRLSRECLGWELLWGQGLPEYDVLLAALV